VSEVIIELDLKRRSGVLAGAVAALRNLSLDFKSQQIVDHEGTPRLVLTTEGEVADLSEVENAYADARGVNGLADVRVDGVSLMHLPPEPEPEAETSPDDAPLRATESDSVKPPAASIDDAETESASSANVDEAEEELFDPEAFARHMLSAGHSGKGPESGSAARDTARTSRSAASETAESAGGLKPSMIRRRRRRR